MSYLQLYQLLANSFQTRTQRFADGACDDLWGAATLCVTSPAAISQEIIPSKVVILLLPEQIYSCKNLTTYLCIHPNGTPKHINSGHN